jgi:hypothetical protein
MKDLLPARPMEVLLIKARFLLDNKAPYSRFKPLTGSFRKHCAKTAMPDQTQRPRFGKNIAQSLTLPNKL